MSAAAHEIREIDVSFPRQFQRAAVSRKRYVVLIGGRGSGKSEGAGRLVSVRCAVEAAHVLCGREFQASIDDSVHKLLRAVIEDKLCIGGFVITDRKIDHLGGGLVRFHGLARNSSAVKSAQGFDICWIEEAHTLSTQSIQDLTPTIRAEGSQLYFTANPQSMMDPFSQRFIVPFQKELERDGFYEDELHTIVMMNYLDNPWFPEALEQERAWDYEHKPRALYNHIWLGAFNDHVEDAIIPAEWFDAAVDAHLKLNIEPRGQIIVAHDPSDKGPDDKGLCRRHGTVVLDVQARSDLDVNQGCDWAVGYAIEHQADVYVWDCDGMGAALRAQTLKAIAGKKMRHVEFRGSKGVDDPNKTYQSVDSHSNQRAKTNVETFKNRRAQYYWALRDMFFNAYRAVERGEYVDPDQMICLDSRIPELGALRSEVCRIPRVPNPSGLIQIMSKDQMLKQKPPIASPNMADALMMTMTKRPKAVVLREPMRFDSAYGSGAVGLPRGRY